jgi:hypothetical protein
MVAKQRGRQVAEALGASGEEGGVMMVMMMVEWILGYMVKPSSH